MLLTAAKEDFPPLEEEKVQHESNKSQRTDVVMSEFDALSTDPPSMEHNVKQFDDVEKIDTMVLHMAQDKAISFATLIPYIGFVIPYEFNDVVEHKVSWFSVLPKMIPKLK